MENDKLFDAIDTNRDGVVDRAEFALSQAMLEEEDAKAQVQAVRKLVGMTLEQKAVFLQQELTGLESELESTKRIRALEREAIDAKHAEWERRLASFESGSERNIDLQNKIIQLQFDLEQEKTKQHSKEFLQSAHRCPTKAVDPLDAKIGAAVDEINSTLPAVLERQQHRRGYSFISFHQDVHNVMQTLGHKGYLNKYTGKKAEWGSTPPDLKVNSPCVNTKCIEDELAKEATKQGLTKEKLSAKVALAKGKAIEAHAVEGQGPQVSSPKRNTNPNVEKKVDNGATPLDPPPPPPNNTYLDDITGTQATLLKARKLKLAKEKRGGIARLIRPY